MTSHSATYFDTVRTVLTAGERVERAVHADRAAAGIAARQLDTALYEQDTGVTSFGRLMFAERPAGAVVEAVVDPDEVFGGVLLEVEVANVALAAGQVLGEAGERQHAGVLQDPLKDLNFTVKELQAGASAAVPEGRLGFRFGGSSDAVQSSTAADAANTFRSSVETSLNGLVSGSSTLTRETWTSISDIPGAKLLDDALGIAREFGGAVESVGTLVDRGLTKLRAAVEALLRLFDLESMAGVRDRLAPIWDKVSSGSLLDAALRGLLRAEAALADARSALDKAHVTARLDAASTSLRALDARFRLSMERASKLRRALAKASALVGALVVLVPGVNLHHLSITLAGFLLLLTGVVLTTMDYADSGTVLGRVRGVRSVIGELAS